MAVVAVAFKVGEVLADGRRATLVNIGVDLGGGEVRGVRVASRGGVLLLVVNRG